MPRATGKNHAQVNLDIWGDDPFLDLPPHAQHLYFVLWTSPQLSYCGTGEWHPGRIASRAKGWTPAAVEQSAVTLSTELFLIVDTDTNEFLLRSWIKHDGLWRGPNMAVSMANARADLASRTLRGVVVHEVKKLKTSEPELSSWTREAVVSLLAQKSIDPAELQPFTPAATPSPTQDPTPPLTPDLTLNAGVGVNPPADPGRTPAPAPTSSSILQRGYVNGVPHQGADPGESPPPPCTRHGENYDHDEGCRQCERRRKYDEAHAADRVRDEEKRKYRERMQSQAAIKACRLCDHLGSINMPDLFGDGTHPTNCPHDADEIERGRKEILATRAEMADK